MKFKQITIIGVGLIGGSIGLAAKRRRLASRIVGVTAHNESLKEALKRKAIDLGTLNLSESVLNSDMVILAVPVDEIIGTIRKAARSLKKGSIVIDVASIKEGIVEKAEDIVQPRGSFVGTHPMAGSERRGVEKARENLFDGAPCILTKTIHTDKKALRAVRNFWASLGARPCVLSPEEHDRRVSNVSHLPHIAASCLSLAASAESLKFAATGFKDSTRVASGNPDLWASILMYNRKNAAKDIDRYIKLLGGVKRLIARGQKNALRRVLAGAKKKRDKLFYRAEN